MRHFVSLLDRFRSDERGAFIAIFGILAIVLIATAGAVVDYTGVEQARTRAQVALDAAALALQPSIYTDTTAQLKSKAQALLNNRIADERISATVTDAQVSTTLGELTLTARMTVPMSFVALVGVNSMDVQIRAQATRKKLNLEVVMVLDNSNSMSSSSRMTNLIAAAKCATNILFNGDCNSTATTASNPNTWIGIVPFTLAVNVGPSNAGASWIDVNGLSSIAKDNFDNDDTSSTAFAGPVNRLQLFNQLSNVSWGGCVEARIHKTTAPQKLYDVDDTPPNPADPDTLFVPYFAPDEPDSGGYNNNYLSDSPSACNYTGTCTYVQTVTSCNSSGSSCGGSTKYSSTLTGLKTGSLSCSCSTSGSYSQTVTGGSSGKSNWTRKRTWTCTVSYAAQGLSDREKQERLCKYTGSASGVSQASVRGPNGDCPTNPITPLTSNKSVVTAAINALAPQGGTNIHAGVIWGFRVLSPTVPFTEGRPYDSTNSKVMIVMTDGENTAYQQNNMNGSTYYSYYGFPWNQRLGTTSWTDAQLETEMDNRTVAACNNAKAAGITIYTIGLSTAATSNQTKVETMLKNCSSGEGYYYFPTAASQLTSVFTEIATQLSLLRLSE